MGAPCQTREVVSLPPRGVNISAPPRSVSPRRPPPLFPPGCVSHKRALLKPRFSPRGLFPSRGNLHPKNSLKDPQICFLKGTFGANSGIIPPVYISPRGPKWDLVNPPQPLLDHPSYGNRLPHAKRAGTSRLVKKIPAKHFGKLQRFQPRQTKAC